MPPMNCHKCGRFIGPDGNPDVIYDEYAGGFEAGYPTCSQCLQPRKRLDPIVKDCNHCSHWKGMANKKKGVRIPGGSGKCTRDGKTHCNPNTVRR